MNCRLLPREQDIDELMVLPGSSASNFIRKPKRLVPDAGVPVADPSCWCLASL